MYFSTHRQSATDCDSWNGSDATSTAGLLEQINSRSFASLDQSPYENQAAQALARKKKAERFIAEVAHLLPDQSSIAVAPAASSCVTICSHNAWVASASCAL
jgi:hypothetical protein